MKLSIVVPCFNEEDVLPETVSRLTELLSIIPQTKISDDSNIYFIDDGSSDKTWSLIQEYSKTNRLVKGIKLSRNKGHQNALLAGMLTVDSDAVISIDADLQDDISIIEKMIDEYHSGHDIVYGVRKERTTDTVFKRVTAQAYYKLLKFLGVDIVFDHADYRLLSRRTLNALQQYGEVNLFLRGLIPTLGYSSSIVEYQRFERFAGESKYPLRKMLAFAIDGITSFSAVPLRLIAIAGLAVFIGTLLMSIWVLWTKFVSGAAIPGWASSVLPMYFLGGIQLLSVGVIGEYVGKIYLETKKRPHFHIETTID
jgi:glycosyltransferase involved in cell wall biosynthesis